MRAALEKIHRPRIIAYSAIFPLVWIVAVVLLRFVLPEGKRAGTVGTALIIMGAAALVSWTFVKRNRRTFTTVEYWRIIAYCVGWVYLFESLVLLAVYTQPEMLPGPLDLKALWFVVPFTATLDAFFVWLAFWQTGRKVIEAYLKKLESDIPKKD